MHSRPREIRKRNGELIIEHESHLSDGDIARFIEGNLDTAGRVRISEHLRSCKRCFETYQDAAVHNWLFEAGSPTYASTKGLAEAGLGAVPGEPGAGIARQRRKRLSSRRQLAFGIAAVCVAVFVAVGLWLRGVDRSGRYVQGSVDLAPVRVAVETASRWGPHVLPGGERLLDEPGSVYRSGSVPLSEPLESSLEHLHGIYRSEGATGDIAYWLVAGKYVTGQIDIARDLASGARERYPGNTRIAVLEALIAYTDGDFDRSVRLFRAILEEAPDTPVANLNLAIVLAWRGDTGEARAILEKLQESQAGTPLASRIESILSDLESR